MMYKKILFLALVTFFLAGIASASDPNLVGWWRMEAADPGDARLVKDSSGFGNDGTMGSSDAWMAGGGIDFDGGSWGPSGIVFANSGADLIADLGLTDQVTVSFVATWADGEKTKTNYPYDGRDASGTADGRLLSMECTGSNHIRNFAGGYDVYSWNSFDDTNEGFLFGSVGKSWGDYIRITTSINLDTGNYKLYVDDQVYHSDPNIYSDPNNIDQFSFEDLSTFTIGRTLWAEMEGKMKDFRIYNRELTEQEIKDFFILASLPLPGNNSVIITLPSLSWQSGIYAVSHDVYLGTTFADVNDATTSSDEFMGNQIANTYDTGSLTEGTYFWRVDEVNDIDVWKGEVWSFEIIAPILWLKMDEPNSSNYRLIEDSSGNGMDGTMGSLDTWIEIPGLGGGIDFDRGYSGASGIVFDFNDINDVITPNLSDQVTVSCWVTWNEWQDRVNYLYDARDSKGIRLLSNECPGLNHIRNHCGTKDIWVWEAFNPLTPSFFRDGATWGDYQRLTTTVNLISGAFKMYIDNELYTSQTVSAGGSMVGITSFYVGRDGTAFGCMGGNMTDFRLYNTVLEPEHIAELVGDYPKQAKVVSPAHESIGHPLNVNLQWRAGKESVAHDVYFGEDYAAVQNANTSSACYMGQQATTTYDPCGLELMKTYYWRIDEIDNESTLWKGNVWSFSSIEYVMVEDFESYDNEGNDVAAVWTDKFGEGDMQILLMNDPCISPVNSMRLRYHVPYPPYYTIAARSFSPAQDWTVNGVKMLTINYYGDAANFTLPLFVTIGDGTTDANVAIADVNTLVEGWQEINISLPDIAAAGVDLNNVSYMEIGLGDGTNLGMSSSKWDIIYIDDIALYPSKCVVSQSSLQADITEDCVVNYDDLDALAFNWLLAGYTVSAVAVSDDDMVLHYDFENNTTDSVAGNNGTLQNLGSAATYDTGHDGSGKSIHFNASSGTSGSNMIVPPAAFADVNEEVTFSMWLKNDTAAPAWYMKVFGGLDVAGDRNVLFTFYSPAFYANMQVVFHAGSGGNTGYVDWDAVNYFPEDNTYYTDWHHYALVKDCGNGEMWIYLNGELMAYRRGEINKMYGCDLFRLGSGYVDGTQFWPGCIDDFRMYNRALSHAEVLTLAGQASATVPLSMFDDAEEADLNTDEAVDFKDYAILANEWLVEDLWP